MAAKIEFSEISKAFPGVQALDRVSFSVESGTITSLIGENGAGKSTLLSILSGEQKPDSGTIRKDGQPLTFSTPRDSQSAGIQIVHQEPHLVPGMTVAENVLLGQLPTRLGIVRRSNVYEKCVGVSQRLGIELEPSSFCGDLGVAQRQMVEIVKALVNDVSVLGLDEPTSTLSEREVSQLFRVIAVLKEEGVAIIYVSHRMEEVLDLSDNFSILRDGKITGKLTKENATEGEIIRLMIGRELKDVFNRVESSIGDVALELKDYVTDQMGPVSMYVRAGEVVGIAGLVGSGRSRLVRAIGGVDSGNSGSLHVHGVPVSLRSPIDALNRDIAVCPEDRKKLALYPFRSMSDNMHIGLNHKGISGFFVRRRNELKSTVAFIERLAIRPANPSLQVSTLSGGNSQKVIVARSLIHRPRILVLDEPTRGIDVGAKSDIYDLIRELAGQGVAIVVTSSELIEILGLSDRIYVMRNGVISGELSANLANEESVMQLAVGSENAQIEKLVS